MQKYFLTILLLFFSLYLIAQLDSCRPSLYTDSLMSFKEKEAFKCLKKVNYEQSLNKKNLKYFDSVINKCFKAEMRYLVPNKYYLTGMGYNFSEGLYISLYIKKFRYLKNRIDQKPWRKKLLMKEMPGIIRIYYYDELICEYK